MNATHRSFPLSIATGDMAHITNDFPILSQTMQHGKRLAFLDSAASSQKPRQVIDTIRQCYEEEYANIHRGIYELSQRTTQRFEEAREKIQRFINAKESREIIFVRGATEAINLVAHSYGRHFLTKGDEIIISTLEHHANIVPWQVLRDEIGIVLRIIPMDDNGILDMAAYQQLLSPRTKLVAVTQVSNALGVKTPIADIIRLAHQAGAKILVDGCQAVAHQAVDVQALDADFYVFSGHKIYGPSGIGVLYGKAALLESMPPYQTGGEMIKSVSFEKTEYTTIPARFEAGTPAIVPAIGLGAAVDYVSAIGFDAIHTHETELLAYAMQSLRTVPGIRFLGDVAEKAGVISFTIDGIHPQDVGTILDKEGVAVRIGHHCAEPLMRRLGVTATIRASLALYNTKNDIDQLVSALRKAIELLR